MLNEKKRYDVQVQKNVSATMRDGTVLRCDVYRPSIDEQFPVLLERTPYDKRSPRFVGQAYSLASRGYVVIVQDTRGRYASDGEFFWEFGE